MKHLILGTAGHIDHGKTMLVKVLTGIDTDRLKEEKARGISIELGFASLELPGGICLGVVDVPGHEKFVRAMVAGVGGIDLVMLVIAADEGIMPQTREHLDILRLLGLRNGLVVLTKHDMVEREWLELVTEEVRDFVTESFLEGAPIVHVSSRSGEGFDELRSELTRLAGSMDEKRREGNFRLPIDRVFTATGFGTVVTGTLMSGVIRIGDDIELIPSKNKGRVRGIQIHGAKTEVGMAGQRLAVNVQGINLCQAQRGDVVVPQDVFRATQVVDVRLDYLDSAPNDLKHRATLRLHSATYEVSAQVILLDHNLLHPGDSAYAQLRLKEPVLLLSGDRYILRISAPASTVGGGVVLDPFPPRRRRRSSEALNLLEAFSKEEHQQIIYLIISQSLLSGTVFENIFLRLGLPRKTVESALSRLLSCGEVLQVTREPRMFLSKDAFETLKIMLTDELVAFLDVNPCKDGMSKEEFKTRLPKRSDPRFFTSLLCALEQDGIVRTDRDIVRLVGRDVQKNGTSEDLSSKIALYLKEGENEPPTVREIMDRFHCDEKCVRDNLALLIRKGEIVRVSSELYYFTDAINGLKEKLISYLAEKGDISLSEYRELTGLSRKFLIPLMEYFDSEKLTIRVGDKRVVRQKYN